jgi:urease accessory protein UreF
MHDDLSVAATYLGLTERELQTKLRSGTTLAQVANATDGKSADGLIDAVVASAQKNIAADVSSGRLTQSQADQVLLTLKQHITARVSSTGPPGGPQGHGGPRGGLDAAASYLELSETDLVTRLQSGKTLGEIADATSGKSSAGLVAALVADEKSHLAQAVKDGQLTQSQADSMAANIEARVTDLVNGTLSARHDGPPRGDGGPPPA